MQLKHYVLLAASALAPLLTSFLAHWDGQITTAAVVGALISALAVFTKAPSQGGAS